MGSSPSTVERQTIDERGAQAAQRHGLREGQPGRSYVEGNERLYKALGLIAADQSLRQLYLDLIGSQVAGFYGPTRRRSTSCPAAASINGADKITFAHEYDHALQDANFPRVRRPEGPPRPDRPGHGPGRHLRGRRDAADDPVGRPPT